MSVGGSCPGLDQDLRPLARRLAEERDRSRSPGTTSRLRDAATSRLLRWSLVPAAATALCFLAFCASHPALPAWLRTTELASFMDEPAGSTDLAIYAGIPGGR